MKIPELYNLVSVVKEYMKPACDWKILKIDAEKEADPVVTVEEKDSSGKSIGTYQIKVIFKTEYEEFPVGIYTRKREEDPWVDALTQRIEDCNDHERIEMSCGYWEALRYKKPEV